VSVAPSRLRRLAAPGSSSAATTEATGATDQLERCELCAEPIAPVHRHVVDLHKRSLLCACRGCSLLLDRPGAGGGHYRLVPERRLRLDRFSLDDARWASLRIPVDLAFFFRSGSLGRVAAVYPSSLGATESQLELSAWEELEAENPILRELEDDVEALLVYRVRSRREHYLVPIDDCYALAGVMRTHWKGLAGGAEVWREIDAFFDRLSAQAL
jgi:hypothetical protein